VERNKNSFKPLGFAAVFVFAAAEKGSTAEQCLTAQTELAKRYQGLFLTVLASSGARRQRRKVS